ncbi:MAG TPA: acetate--CoA ligase family protein [candidate division Zixibacteria bacterium]|nr:acetate--CoA ligase family protein [candidate division Zixibacteria bacterium]
MESPEAGIVYRDVEPLLRPRSITIVGASGRPGSWSERIYRNLRRYGFPGEIHLVNPRHRALYGEPCHPSVREVPGVVDQLVVIVPSRHVPAIIEEGGSRGCRSAVIFSGGFSETGERSGIELEQALLEVAERHGVRLCGPNCLGNISTRERVLTYAEQAVEDYSPGGLALVSQSSGLMGGVARHAAMRGLGLSYSIASGSEANTDAADYLDFLVEDEHTRVIVLVLEAIRRPDAFAAACRKALERKKPILVLKIGKSRRGRDAILTHTGALAGSHDAFVAFCRKHGLLEVHDLEECVDAAELFLRCPLPKAPGVAAIALSGGARSYLYDLGEELDLDFPEPGPAARKELEKLLGVGSGIGNPVDLGASGASDPEQQLRCVELLGSDPAVGLIAFQGELPQGAETSPRTLGLQKIAAQVSRLGKPIVFFSRSCYPLSPAAGELGARSGASFLQGIRASFRAISHLIAYHRALESRAGTRCAAREPAQTSVSAASTQLFLSDLESFALLERAGIAVARYEICDGREAALRAAERIGYPVALKASLPGLAHKSRTGAVRLGIDGPQEVAESFDLIRDATSKLAPAPALVLVQEMVRGKAELYVGGRRDREFGPLVLFGFGGVFVEDIARVCTRLAPIDASEAEAMIRESGVERALQRLGLAEPATLRAVADAIVGMSRLIALSADLDTVEINPLLVTDDRRTCVAVDVLSLRRRDVPMA